MNQISKINKMFKTGVVIAVALVFILPSIAIADLSTKKGNLELIGLSNYVSFTQDVFYPQENLTIEYNYNSRFLIRQECRLQGGGLTDTLMIEDDHDDPVIPLPVSVHIVLRDSNDDIIGFWGDLSIGRHTLDGGQLKDFPMLGEYTVQMAFGDFSHYVAKTDDDQEPVGSLLLISEDIAEVTLPVSYVVFDQIGYHYNETMNIWYSLDETEFMHIGLYNASGVRVIYWGDLSEGINAIQYTAPPDPPELEGVWTVQLINGDPADHEHRIRGEVECEHDAVIHPCDNPRYAVVVCGSVWNNHQYDSFLMTTDHVYRVLLDKGYTDDNIYYLNDGHASNYNSPYYPFQTDGYNTKNNVDYAIWVWLADKLASNGETENVVIYFVGHGDGGVFRTGGFTIGPTELKDWLDEALLTDNGDPTCSGANIVMECCDSGFFIEDFFNNICGKNRVVMTAADASQGAAYCYYDGECVFSKAYLENIEFECNAEDAFDEAYWWIQDEINPNLQEGAEWQYPQIDDQFYYQNPYLNFGW